MEAVARGRNSRYQKPIFPSDDDATVAKALGVAGRQATNCWHGSDKSPSMCIASMDINTAFDVARPTHIANNMVGHVDGWITAELLRELEGARRARDFRASSNSRVASARTLKLPRFGSNWQCRFSWNAGERMDEDAVGSSC